jgi:hypothetical protein
MTRLGKYISTRLGFLSFSMVAAGIPAAIVGVLLLKEDLGSDVYVVVIPCALVFSYLWGEVMWRIRFRDLFARNRTATEKLSPTDRPG